MKGGFLSLQTSLILPELPPKSTRLCSAKFCFALYGAGALGGKFLSFGEVGDFCRVRLRARWVGGMRRERVCLL